MQILIRGLRRNVTEAMLRDLLAQHVAVNAVEIIREGDPERPWAWVDLAVDRFMAWSLLRQMDRHVFAGGRMHWYILVHQEPDAPADAAKRLP